MRHFACFSVSPLFVGAFGGLSSLVVGMLAPAAYAQTVNINIDANTNRHAISPEIYGLEEPTASSAADLGAGAVRYGGNHTSTYNWQLNAANRASDFFFESIAYPSSVAGEYVDTIVATANGAGAKSMVTVPAVNFIAKLGVGRSKLCSFSTLVYGSQQFADGICGNGFTPAGAKITGNNPLDAYIPNTIAFQQSFVQHLVDTWGNAALGGVKYYLIDNEPSIWHQTHRDIQPHGLSMDEMVDVLTTYSGAIKSVDPTAKVVGPEEWGWFGYFFSGRDQEAASIAFVRPFPDEAAHSGAEYLPYVLDQVKQYDSSHSTRTLDVFSVHFYPQGGEFGDDTSTAMQLLRNRSTRALWDRSYVNESWINEPTYLIPFLREWADEYYFSDVKLGLTEYNWGAKNHMNGATTQADILGIFGREGLDVASIFQFNNDISPTTTIYKAFKMYRNYDGAGSQFGNVSVQASVPNPDDVSAFAAERSSDGALTVMVINKKLSDVANIQLNLNPHVGTNINTAAPVQVVRLANNVISNQPSVSVNTAGGSPVLTTTLPAQSVTLFVIPQNNTTSLDSDGDGVGNASDSFPCEPTASSMLAYPAENTFATRFFEDQWPSKGDFDFNDAVIDHNTEVYFLDGQVSSIRMHYQVRAYGALFDNGIGVHLPIDFSQVVGGASGVVIERKIGSGPTQTISPIPLESDIVVPIAGNIRSELFAGAAGQINTVDASAPVASVPVVITVRFAAPVVGVPTSHLPFDVFMWRASDYSHQIHEMDTAGTDRVNGSLFNTADDTSTGVNHYVTGGIPFVLDVPTSAPFAKEGTRIETLFPHIVDFAASGGASFSNFYAVDVNNSKAYTHIGSLTTTPTITPRAGFSSTACVP